MRRLILVALCGTLVLSACSDQSRESPTEPSVPSPEADFGSCQPVRFPFVQVSALILKVFPAGRLRVEALIRAGAIAILWDTCKRAPAQKSAIAFVDWMNRNSAQLIGTQAQRNTLVNLILNGVGIPGSVPSTSPGDFGVGFFDHTSSNPLVVETVNGTALTELPAHSFDVDMIIKVGRNSDNADLHDFNGRQFPPNFDYDAIRSDGATTNADHVLQNGKKAAIVFCLLPLPNGVDPANLRIGHNPVQEAPGFPFEILEKLDLVNVRPDLAAKLQCDANLHPFTTVIGGFGGGVSGFATAAWRTAGHHIGPIAQALFMPPPLWAATAVGKLPPPIGGNGGSLSPFKAVEPATITPSAGNGQSAPAGSAVPVPPAVVVRNAFTEAPVPGVSITFAVASGGGSITGPTAVTNASGVAAVGSWTLGAAPGTNTLTATATGLIGSPVVFTATAVVEDPLVLNVTAVEKLPGGTQRFFVQSGSPGPYIWSVNGVDGGNATYGTIITNPDFTADFTAPAAVPSTPTFNVCARRQANPSNAACAAVTIKPVPSSGADVIVFNDLNVFDNTAAADPNNLLLYANLVSYTGSGTRAANTRVLVHRGHSVRCFEPLGNQECSPSGWSTFESTMRAVGTGYTVDDVDDASASLTSIAANVKVIILALPMTSYSTAEINALKNFAGEGGRIVFVGEWDGFYGVGITVENDFLTNMGAVMRNTGGAVDCFDDPPAGYKVLPSSSLRSHQVTTGLAQLTIVCASVVQPGPNDYALFYDRSGLLVLGAVAKVDLTPLSLVAGALSRMSGIVAPRSAQPAARSNDASGRGVVSKASVGRPKVTR